MSHNNLVRIFGACFDDQMKVLLIEHCNKGSLQVGQEQLVEHTIKHALWPRCSVTENNLMKRSSFQL